CETPPLLCLFQRACLVTRVPKGGARPQGGTAVRSRQPGSGGRSRTTSSMAHPGRGSTRKGSGNGRNTRGGSKGGRGRGRSKRRSAPQADPIMIYIGWVA